MGIGNIKLAVNDATATIPKYKHRKSFKDQLHRLQTTWIKFCLLLHCFNLKFLTNP